MQPHLTPNDKDMFMRYLAGASHYFEYGSGGSTVVACNCSNIHRVYSVESDAKWYEKVKAKANPSKLTFMFKDLHTESMPWGRPGLTCPPDAKKAYSDAIMTIPDATNIDLMLIDGRFRVACCLKSHAVISDTCIVLFDDFFPREFYHDVLNYFDVVEKTSDNNMAVLKKKPGLTVPSELIARYEMDFN